MELEAKRGYVRVLLELLRDLRWRTGLPHRVVVDEAHYFLGEEDVGGLLDLELGGYTLVTWHASQLHRDVLAAPEAILVTRVSDLDEARALHALRGGGHELDDWCARLGSLERQWAALLPGAEESGEELVRFRVSARLTPHLRHLQKYLNRRAPEGRGFVLRGGRTADSVGELLGLLSAAPDLDWHLQKNDLSRWIRDVLEDRVLANRVRALEDRWRAGRLPQPHLALITTIRQPYGAGAPSA